MNYALIPTIQGIAQEIDCRINLFEGFCPKCIATAKGESLFWRNVVSIYGLFADCDNIQIKKSSNLFSLMKQYSFISKEDYMFVKLFWSDISALRKWFCHNTDESLFYQEKNIKNVERYLNNAYLISTEKPTSLEDTKLIQWSLINADIERRFDAYLSILTEGLTNWKNSDLRNEAVDYWIEIFSIALFEDDELIENIIAEIANFEMKNFGLNSTLKAYSKIIREELKEKDFSVDKVKTYIEGMVNYKSNKDIIYEVIKIIRIE